MQKLANPSTYLFYIWIRKLLKIEVLISQGGDF
jgi:hypothetical protein